MKRKNFGSINTCGPSGFLKQEVSHSEACEKGKVKNEAGQVKPSKQVHTGDVYEVKTEAKRWRIQVTGLLYHRVAFADAVKYYLDITPAEEVERIQFQAASFHTGKRLSKVGRPTKKQRRDLDEMQSE